MTCAWAQEMPPDYAGVLNTLDRQGDYKDNVLKINIPRNDVKVVVDGVATPTPFGFGGWIAFSKGAGGMDVMMGDLVLTEAEVNPVMSAVLDNGYVVAIHHHMTTTQPTVYFLHYWGKGPAQKLATGVRAAVDQLGKGGETAHQAH